MNDRNLRLDRLANQGCSICLILIAVLFVALYLRGTGFFPGLMEIILLVDFIFFTIIGFFVLMAWVKITDSGEEGSIAPLNRPGQEPGRRTWKHDVFDENAYAILGVPQNATRAEIRDAFRSLMQKYHPDASTPEEKEHASLIFVQLDQAYELLSHTENRARYDAWIEHLGGREPPLDIVTDAFKNPFKLAQFDEMFPLALDRLKNQEPPAPEREPISRREGVPSAATETNPPPTPVPEAQTQTAQPAEANSSPLEVDIPDAVREAMGLPDPKK